MCGIQLKAYPAVAKFFTVVVIGVSIWTDGDDYYISSVECDDKIIDVASNMNSKTAQ